MHTGPAWKWIAAACAAALLAPLAHAQKEDAGHAGKKLLQRLCAGCHDMALTTNKRATREDWRYTVDKMVAKGAEGTEDELNKVIDYLAEHYGPAKNGQEESTRDNNDAPGEAAAKLNINKAAAGKIAGVLQLSGADAAAIVRYRETKGTFKGWPDLKKVPGLDLKKLEARKDRIEF